MVCRRFLLPALLLAFGISYSKWYNFIVGFWNLFFAFIISYLMLILFYRILKYFALKEGFEIEIRDYNIQKETKMFNYIKKEVVSIKRTLPFGYLATLFFIFLSAGSIFPFIPITFSLKQHPVYKVGKSKKEMEYDRRFSVLIKTLIIFVTVVLILRYIFQVVKLSEIYYFVLHVCIILLITYLLPWSFLLSFLVIHLLKWEYTTSHLSDIVLMVDGKKYLAALLLILIYFTFGLLFNPILALVIAILISLYVWLREFYIETLKNV